MYLRTLVLLAAYYFSAATFAVDVDLSLPPIISPEEFDQPITLPTGDLSLKQAILLTLKHNPQLAAHAWTIKGEEMAEIEAGLRPNPALLMAVENIAGSGNFSGIDATETTLALSQLIELGDKRVKRKNLALNDQYLARWEYEITRIDLLATMTKSYINVLSLQEIVAIQKETYELADEVYKTISTRVKAGKATKLEEMKARVEVSRSRLQSLNATRQLTAYKHLLTQYWGSDVVSYTNVLGDLYNTKKPPKLQQVIQQINKNPDLKKWVSVIQREESAVLLAEANSIPDITISAGVKHLNETDDVAAVANISLPLFIFDNKKTGIKKSQIELNKARQDQLTSEINIRTALKENYQHLMILYDEAIILRDEVLPVSAEAFNTAKKIYEVGKLDLLGLLDTQRTYFDIRKQYIDTVTAYQIMVITMERLIGGGLETFSNLKH